MQHFEIIFDLLRQDLKLETKPVSVLDYKKLCEACRFTLAVAIEFKKNKITYRQANGIDNVADLNQALHSFWMRENFEKNSIRTEEEKSAAKSYSQVFADAYFNGESYNFYRSIFDFITGGNEFDYELLKKELKVNIDDKEVIPSPQEEVYRKLGYPGVFNLSNEEVVKLTEEMYQYALAGDYSLDKYLSVLYYLSRFKGILNYDLEHCGRALEASLEINIEKISYDGYLNYHGDENKETTYDRISRSLFGKLKEVNEKVKKMSYE